MLSKRYVQALSSQGNSEIKQEWMSENRRRKRMHEDISAKYQLDQRWIERYRQITFYDPSWWWAPAGPMRSDEQNQWDQHIGQEQDAATKELLDRLIVHSRDRELTAALSEQREPRFHYPVLAHYIGEVRSRIEALHQLDREILREEPHPIVRRLYHETMTEEEIDFLHLIKTAHTGDTDRFWEITRLLHPLPTPNEMEYPLAQLKAALLEGLRYTETVDLSQSLIQFVRERFQLHTLITDQEIAGALTHLAPLPPGEIKQTVSSQAVKRFFESILQEAGYTEWSVEIDPKAGGASVLSTTRRLRIREDPIPLERVRHLLSHEIAGHVARSIAGEQSPLGLLAIGTVGYRNTEEGLALYNERRVASLHGEKFDESGTWLTMLTVGLAAGTVTPPQTFTSLLQFCELLYAQRRLCLYYDDNLEDAQKQAKKRAVSRCLRTFEGVPDLNQAGVCSTKDVVYWRGLRLIEQAVTEDETVLDRLTAGKFALGNLQDIAALQIVAPPQPLRERAFDPNLDQYILSFEDSQ